MLVKVFLETFKNMKKRPGLIMKTSGAGFSVMDREDIMNKIIKVSYQKNINSSKVFIHYFNYIFSSNMLR